MAYRHETENGIWGFDPPLLAPGAKNARIERRPINGRWLAGALLVALFGSALMAGAVITSLDKETRFARPPEAAQRQIRNDGSGPNILRKGDRLVPFSEAITMRQTLRIAFTAKTNDREVIRQRPFTRVSASLATAITLENKIPEFNPMRLMGDELNVDKINTNVAVEEGDISIAIKDLHKINEPLNGPTILEQDALRAASDTFYTQKTSKLALPTLALNPGSALQTPNRDSQGNVDVLVVPENVLSIPKSSNSSTRGGLSEKASLIRSGQNADEALRTQEMKANEASAIASALSRLTDVKIDDGQRLTVLYGPTPTGEMQPMRVTVSAGDEKLAIIALTDNNRWVEVEIEETDVNADESEAELAEEKGGVAIYKSIYETALRQDVPKTVIEEIIRVFAYDIDLQRRVSPGDSFDVFFSDDTEGGQHDILYAALTLRGDTRTFYRFQSNDDGAMDYYDETGKSARKFLMRKPMNGGIFRSAFGMRRHPVLRYSKMHTGVDWADSVGTPIFAAGSGIVEKAEWDSGYGRRIEIRHTNGYVTTYSHLSGFSKNIKEGARVRQGQVIGYLGSSGLSTGPHLHYEVMINGRFVDPLRIRLPKGRELEGRLLAEFKNERDRINNYIGKAQAVSSN